MIEEPGGRVFSGQVSIQSGNGDRSKFRVANAGNGIHDVAVWKEKDGRMQWVHCARMVPFGEQWTLGRTLCMTWASDTAVGEVVRNELMHFLRYDRDFGPVKKKGKMKADMTKATITQFKWERDEKK